MRKIRIADKIIGDEAPCFIVAEAGINHNGDVELAKQLIKKAVESGADAIKFQSYHTENFVSKKSAYYRLFKKFELSEDDFKELNKFANKEGIIFLSTPLDLEYVDILKEIGVPAFKIASGDITFAPLLEKVAKTGKPVILSTGMATISEISEAVSILRENGCDNIVLLHCISCYPTPFEEVNLKAMVTLKNIFNLPVGFSDHTPGIIVPIAAVALGAKIIEKHFTLDKNLHGPDHKLSADPEEFKRMVEEIRIIEKALGDGFKKPRDCEKDARIHGRRSIMAKVNIPRGSIITREMIKISRPGNGIEPKFIDLVVGKVAKKHIAKDEVITWDKI